MLQLQIMFVTFSYTDTFEERSEYHKAKKRKKMTEDSESSEPTAAAQKHRRAFVASFAIFYHLIGYACC